MENPFARIIAIDTHDAERCDSFFNTEPLESDRPSALPSSSAPSPETGEIPEPSDLVERMTASDANYGQLSADQKTKLMTILD